MTRPSLPFCLDNCDMALGLASLLAGGDAADEAGHRTTSHGAQERVKEGVSCLDAGRFVAADMPQANEMIVDTVAVWLPTSGRNDERVLRAQTAPSRAELVGPHFARSARPLCPTSDRP